MLCIERLDFRGMLVKSRLMFNVVPGTDLCKVTLNQTLRPLVYEGCSLLKKIFRNETSLQ